MLGHRDRVGDARCHEENAALVERRHLDRVEADAEPGHHHHVRRHLELGLAERRTAQSHGMHVLQLGMQRARRIVSQDLVVNVVTLLQRVDAGLRHAPDDQHFFAVSARCHGRFPCISLSGRDPSGRRGAMLGQIGEREPRGGLDLFHANIEVTSDRSILAIRRL